MVFRSKREKVEQDWRNCIIRCFVICAAHKIQSG